MQTNRKYITFIPFLSLAFLVGCNDANYSVSTFKELTPDVYVYSTIGEKPTVTKNETYSGKIPVCLINNNDIPYISIKTGVEVLYSNTLAITYKDVYSGYSYVNKDYTTTITNKANNSNCVINYTNQTMEFDDYTAFVNNDKDQLNPLDVLFSNGRQYFKDIKQVSYTAGKSKLTVDLKKYNIPIYYYYNEGYIPNEVFNNLLSPMIQSDVVFVNNNIYINGESSNQNVTNRIALNKELNFSFSSKYMEYCYNLNALTLDVSFGQRQRESRANPGTTIKYNLDAYSNMEKYDKNSFLSTDHNVANQALMKTINKEYDDGGHTVYQRVGFLENEEPDIPYGDEAAKFVGTYTPLILARKDAELNPTQTTGKSNAIGDFKLLAGHADTAFLTMDKFVANSNYKTADYYTNTMSLVYYANEQLHDTTGEFKDVTKLVIDLSLNTGGDAYSALFMSSWLSNGTSHIKECSYVNESFSDITYKADINGDGEITELDYLPDGIQIYVIATPCSYSCGNLIPCDLRDYTSAKFIGNCSGGGCCGVRANVQTGYGSTYQMSSHYCICRVEATAENLISNDAGAGVKDDKDYAISLAEPAKYYDRATLYSEYLSK